MAPKAQKTACKQEDEGKLTESRSDQGWEGMVHDGWEPKSLRSSCRRIYLGSRLDLPLIVIRLLEPRSSFGLPPHSLRHRQRRYTRTRINCVFMQVPQCFQAGSDSRLAIRSSQLQRCLEA